MLESISYICLADQPVSEWLDLKDDLWATAAIDCEQQVWELMWWLGTDWLFERITPHIPDNDWSDMISRNVDDVLYDAIHEMLKKNSPYEDD